MLGRDQVSIRDQLSHTPCVSHVATGDGTSTGNDLLTTANESYGMHSLPAVSMDQKTETAVAMYETVYSN